METRQCNACGEELPSTIEYFHKKLDSVATRCKNCDSMLRKQLMVIIPYQSEDGYNLCIKCGIEKSLGEFHFRNDTQKYRNECIDCRLAGKREYYKKHPELNEVRIENGYFQQYYQENKDGILDRGKRYNQTPNGILVNRRKETKRRRNLKYIELFMNPFPKEIDVDYHHINDILVIPLPRELHRSTYGKYHRDKCAKVIKEIYGIDVINMIRGDFYKFYWTN